MTCPQLCSSLRIQWSVSRIHWPQCRLALGHHWVASLTNIEVTLSEISFFAFIELRSQIGGSALEIIGSHIHSNVLIVGPPFTKIEMIGLDVLDELLVLL